MVSQAPLTRVVQGKLPVCISRVDIQVQLLVKASEELLCAHRVVQQGGSPEL